MNLKTFHIVFIIQLLLSTFLFAQPGRAHVDRRSGMHDGNLVRSLVYNYGSIGRPNTEPSLEWPSNSSHGYAYEFGLLVGAEVVDAYGDTVVIFSDGMLDGGDYNPTGGANWWGWEPLPGYSSVNSIAMSNDSTTWPDNWNTWPGKYGDGQVVGNLESYYVMDDRFNREFEYYPTPSDSSIRGLGIEVSCRGYQWNNPTAEDFIIYTYEMTNVSERTLNKVVVGMIGDPHIGGAGDFADDWACYIDNMGYDSFTGQNLGISGLVYSWDNQGSGNDFAISWEDLGWLGFKLLETPGIDNDGIDNDGDGLTDESQSDNIDNDGDWNSSDIEALADTAEAFFWWDPIMWNGVDDDGDGRIDDWGDIDGLGDDVGEDGIPNTSDMGEDDGMPTIGEPDFESNDTDESDMVGLSSFWAPIYGLEEAHQDEGMWMRMMPGTFASANDIAQNTDNILIFGSGYFSLDPGETANYSVGVILGHGKDDLIYNAKGSKYAYARYSNGWADPHQMTVINPIENEEISGIYEIQWISESSTENSLNIKLYYNLNRGEGWQLLAENEPDDGSFTWETTEFSDGYNYQIMVEGSDIISRGYDTTSYFSVNNPENLADPEIVLIKPNDDDILTEDVDLRWRAGDADEDITLTVSVQYKRQTDSEWSTLIENEANDGVFDLNTTMLPIGLNNIRLSATDGTILTESQIIGVQIVNDFPSIPDSMLIHIEGSGDGGIDVIVVEPNSTTGHLYQMTFDDTSFSDKTYDVYDLNTGDFVIQNASQFNSQYPGPLFDGLRLIIDDLPMVSLDETNTGWVTGNSNLNLSVSYSLFGGLPLPVDYRIDFYDIIVDTSVIINPQPLNFLTWNTTDNEQVDVVFSDNDNDGVISIGDQIDPLYYTNDTPRPTWSIEFEGPPSGNPVLPQNGDALTVVSIKPFTYRDIFHIQSPFGLSVSTPDQSIPNRYSLSQNFPNPFNPTTTIQYEIPQRSEVQVIIYNVLGREITTLVSEIQEAGFKSIQWDASDVESGIYFYQVRAEGFVQTKKMILLK